MFQIGNESCLQRRILFVDHKCMVQLEAQENHPTTQRRTSGHINYTQHEMVQKLVQVLRECIV